MQYSAIIGALRRYTGLLWWLTRDSVFRYKRASLFVLATGFFGLVFQIQALGVVVYYAKYFSSGERLVLQVLGTIVEWNPRTSVALLLLTGGVVLVSLLLSAVSLYWSRRGIVELGRRYNETCTERVLEMFSGTKVISLNSINKTELDNENYLILLATGDSRLCGWSLRLLLETITPVLTLLAAFGALFYLGWDLTSLIMLCMVVYLVFQYYVTKRAAHYSVEFERNTSAARQECVARIRRSKQDQVGGGASSSFISDLFASGPFKRAMDAYEGRLVVVAESKLVSGIFMAIVLALVLLVMGADIIRTGTGWGNLLVYVIALRFAMVNLEAVFGRITGINRFYPQLRRYFLFVTAADREIAAAATPPGTYALEVKEPLFAGSATSEIVGRGDRLAVVSPIDLNRYTAGSILDNLLEGSAHSPEKVISSLRFVTSLHPSPGNSTGELLKLSTGAGWDDVDVPPEMIDRLRAHLPRGLDQPLTESAWSRLDSDLRVALMLLSSIQSPCQWILVEERAFYSLGRPHRVLFRERLAGKITVIVFHRVLARVGIYDEKAVAVLGDKGIVGLGTPAWFKDKQEQVLEYYGQADGRRKAEREVDAGALDLELHDA